MVRLLPANLSQKKLAQLLFQSHNGAIAAVAKFIPISVKHCCFNPTMVRLLPSVYDCFSDMMTFQSHNGAIAAAPKKRVSCRPSLFQSHNGAIAAHL